MAIISIYIAAKQLQTVSNILLTPIVSKCHTKISFLTHCRDKPKNQPKPKPKPKMESLQFPQFTRQELIAYHANKISQAMQARHLQQLKMLCLVPSNGLNK